MSKKIKRNFKREYSDLISQVLDVLENIIQGLNENRHASVAGDIGYFRNTLHQYRMDEHEDFEKGLIE